MYVQGLSAERAYKKDIPIVRTSKQTMISKYCSPVSGEAVDFKTRRGKYTMLCVYSEHLQEPESKEVPKRNLGKREHG